MSLKFHKQSVEHFLDVLGSEAVSPGGGTAAALTAATGLALVEMVARINSKKRSAAKNVKVSKIRQCRKRLENIMDEDAATFLKLSAFYKKKDKGPRYQSALKNAAGVPLKICEISLTGLLWAKHESSFTGRWLMSDLVQASVLLEAAFRSAKLNVEINLKETADKNFVSEIRKRLFLLERKIRSLK